MPAQTSNHHHKISGNLSGVVIIKPNPTSDFYIMWSTSGDYPLGWGTRAELTADHGFTAAVSEARFDRADTRGSSTQQGYWFTWNYPTMLLRGIVVGTRLLPRENLRALCAALSVGDKAELLALSKDLQTVDAT